jgi:alpha-mannosidase
LVSLEPSTLVLSAFKPAEDGDGAIVRVLNPTDDATDAELRFGVAVADVSAIRLDEQVVDKQAVDDPVQRDGDVVRIGVPPHALRSVRVRWS